MEEKGEVEVIDAEANKENKDIPVEEVLKFSDVGSLSDFIATYSLTSVTKDPKDFARLNHQNAIGKLQKNVKNAMTTAADIQNHKDRVEMVVGDAKLIVMPLLHSVTMRDFKPYLTVHGDLMDVYEKNHLHAHRILSKTEKQTRDDETASKDLVHCHNNVPDFFFTDAFSIEDAVYFDKATTGDWTMEIIEKLQSQLDLVEVALMKQIFAKSEAFFDTPTKLEELKKDIVRALSHIDIVNDKLKAITKNVIAPTLSITQRKRRLKNITEMHAVTNRIKEIKNIAKQMPVMLNGNDYLRAMKSLQSIKELVTPELMNLKCLVPTLKQLKEHEATITSTMAAKFEAVAMNFNFTDSGDNDDMDDATLASQLYPLAQGLVQAGNLMTMFVSYKARIKLEIANIVRFVVNREIGGGKNAENIQGALKSMETLDFLSLLESVFEHLLLVTHRVSRVNTIMLGCLGVDTVAASALKDDDEPPKEYVKLDGEASVNPYVENKEVKDVSTVPAVGTKNTVLVTAPVKETVKENVKDNKGVDAKTVEENKKVVENKTTIESKITMENKATTNAPNVKDAKDNKITVDANRTAKVLEAFGASPTKEVKDNKETLNVEVKKPKDLNSKNPADVVEETHEILKMTCTYAQKHVIKLLEPRQEVHAKYSIADLHKMWELALHFTNQSEKHGGKRVKLLLVFFVTQATANLKMSHDSHMEEINREMDGEEWKQLTVSSDIQDCVNSIMTGDLYGAKTYPPATRKTLTINDQELRIVNTLSIILRWLYGYLQYASKFPALLTDVVNNTVALLRSFNNNSTRLILNAKARELGIVKQINAKHLCLVAQCLSVIILMVPQISHFIGTLLPAEQHNLLHSFDSLIEEVSKHREDLYNKLVIMVTDGLDKGLQEALIDKTWINDTKKVSPSPYIADVVKTSQLLHKALSVNLSENEVLEVFSRLMTAFGEKLPAYFSGVEPTKVSVGGKAKIIADVTYLITEIRKFGALREQGHNLEMYFRSRYGLS